MSNGRQGQTYALLDSRNTVLAKGILENPPDAPNWQVRVLDHKISAVMEHEEIRLVPIDGDGAALLGRIIRNRNDSVLLQKLKTLGSDMRQDLRVPTHFKTFIYPLTGQWQGRRRVEANDLSCGGAAFFCAQPLEDGERLELVVPITSEPLIVQCQVLRRRPSDREGQALYATKFVDLCNDEEMIVREAVFSVQVEETD